MTPITETGGSRQVDCYSLRLHSPMTTAHGTITERRVAVVTISDGPHAGRGEVSVLPGFGLESQAAAEATLHRWAVDDSKPLGPGAVGAIAAATASLAASRTGVGLAEFLAGRRTPDSVATQAVIGDGDVAETVAAAVTAATNGHAVVKVKVAAAAPQRDIERIGAVRAAVGRYIGIRLDANCGWDAATAEHVLGSVAHHDIDLVEEPTQDPEDFPGIQSATGMTIALDEHAVDPTIVEAAMRQGIGAVVLKPAIIGGPIAAHTLATRLIEDGVRVVISSFMDGWVGLETAVQVAAALPTDEVHGLGTATMFLDVFPAELVPSGGRVMTKVGTPERTP